MQSKILKIYIFDAYKCDINEGYFVKISWYLITCTKWGEKLLMKSWFESGDNSSWYSGFIFAWPDKLLLEEFKTPDSDLLCLSDEENEGEGEEMEGRRQEVGSDIWSVQVSPMGSEATLFSIKSPTSSSKAFLSSSLQSEGGMSFIEAKNDESFLGKCFFETLFSPSKVDVLDEADKIPLQRFSFSSMRFCSWDVNMLVNWLTPPMHRVNLAFAQMNIVHLLLFLTLLLVLLLSAAIEEDAGL